MMPTGSFHRHSQKLTIKLPQSGHHRKVHHPKITRGQYVLRAPRILRHTFPNSPDYGNVSEIGPFSRRVEILKYQ